MEKYLNTSLSADCSSRVYDCGRGLRGLAHAAKSSHKSGSVVAVANARHASPGCAPLTDGAGAGTWRGKRTRRVYTDGVLQWLRPGCCSKVFLWADLTQPGGEVHWSNPVRAKSKG